MSRVSRVSRVSRCPDRSWGKQGAQGKQGKQGVQGVSSACPGRPARGGQPGPGQPGWCLQVSWCPGVLESGCRRGFRKCVFLVARRTPHCILPHFCPPTFSPSTPYSKMGHFCPSSSFNVPKRLSRFWFFLRQSLLSVFV